MTSSGVSHFPVQPKGQSKSEALFSQSSYDVMEIIQKKRKLHHSQSTNDSTSPTNRPAAVDTRPSFVSVTNNVLEANPRLPPSDPRLKPRPAKLDMNNFLASILDWKSSWLQKPSPSDPPVLCEEPLQQLKLDYASADEYIRFYKPLVLNEIWAQICERVDALKKSKPCKIQLFIHACQAEEGFLVLTCVLPVTNLDFSQNSYPFEGDLTLTEISILGTDANSSDSGMLVLGYVSEFVVDEITKKTQLSKHITYSSNCKKLLRYTIRLRLMNVKIDVTKNVNCCSIYYLKPKLKQCQALANLDLSALAEGILKPELQLLPIKLDHNLREDGKFNTSQQNVIYNANKLVNGSLPGILLVQGPPGAGKTHTLIGMVKRIFLDWKDSASLPKLLICAPSNGAIDEIGKRLYKEKAFLRERANRELQMVRIGQEDSLGSFVKENVYIDALVEQNIQMKANNNARGAELTEKVAELNQLKIRADALVRAKEFEELRSVNSRMQVLRDQIGKQKRTFNKKRMAANTELLRKRMRTDILTKADVVLTTLTSCCKSSLVQALFDRPPFNCCIVDEASQCNEPELLMPLYFNLISKMILVGDPMQLPATTISPVAAKYGFGQSLFERFHKYLQSKPLLTQFHIMLNIQYRMHSEICSLPSRLFYSNRLGTDCRTDRRRFPLQPYRVFDVQDTAECKQNVKNIHNQLESDFVVMLTKKCVEVLESYERFRNCIVRIGIITPYQGRSWFRLFKLPNRLIPIRLNLKL